MEEVAMRIRILPVVASPQQMVSSSAAATASGANWVEKLILSGRLLPSYAVEENVRGGLAFRIRKIDIQLGAIFCKAAVHCSHGLGWADFLPAV
jgi:hypothetical protein